MTQVAVVSGIAAVMTVGVYGLVGGIVKLDDLGLYMTKRAGAATQAIGRTILAAAPWLMKFLSVAGTAAMFLVGGGILVHGVPALHHAVQHVVEAAGGSVGWLVEALANGAVGVVAGGIIVAVVTAVSKLRKRTPAAARSAQVVEVLAVRRGQRHLTERHRQPRAGR